MRPFAAQGLSSNEALDMNPDMRLMSRGAACFGTIRWVVPGQSFRFQISNE